MLKRFLSRTSEKSRDPLLTSARDHYDQPEPGPPLPSRRQFKSSGRGGAGNIHTFPAPGEHTQASHVKTPRKVKSFGPGGSGNMRAQYEDVKTPRRVRSFGRGGSGNMRAQYEAANKPSPLPDAAQLEYDYIRAHRAWRAHQPQSTGRGGAGNIRTPPGPIGRALQILVTITKLNNHDRNGG